MDWNLFWSAFGAIGSTLGSLITAGAVIVAIKQYEQPLKKILKVEFVLLYNGEYRLSVKNIGVRNVQITKIYVIGPRRKVTRIWVSVGCIQVKTNGEVVFPIKLEPEDTVTIYIDKDVFQEEIRKAVNGGLKKRNKLVFHFQNSFSDGYSYKTNIRIGKLIKGL